MSKFPEISSLKLSRQLFSTLSDTSNSQLKVRKLSGFHVPNLSKTWAGYITCFPNVSNCKQAEQKKVSEITQQAI